MLGQYVHIKAKEAEGTYYCPQCEQWTDDIAIEEWDEYREFWGMPSIEHLIEWRCPNCGSDAITNDWVLDDEE